MSGNWGSGKGEGQIQTPRSKGQEWGYWWEPDRCQVACMEACMARDWQACNVCVPPALKIPKERTVAPEWGQVQLTRCFFQEERTTTWTERWSSLSRARSFLASPITVLSSAKGSNVSLSPGEGFLLELPFHSHLFRERGSVPWKRSYMMRK